MSIIGMAPEEIVPGLRCLSPSTGIVRGLSYGRPECATTVSPEIPEATLFSNG
jgi:hypothetical protein